MGSMVFTGLRFETAIQAFILAPVAVANECQGRGIGQVLIAHGLAALSQDGVELAIIYGDSAFDARVRFQPVVEAVIPPPCRLQQPHGWLAQSLKGGPIRPINGSCTCVEPSTAAGGW